jgi:hypothetical protein
VGSFEPEAEPPSEIGKILFAFAAGFVRMPFKVLDHFYPKFRQAALSSSTIILCRPAKRRWTIFAQSIPFTRRSRRLNVWKILAQVSAGLSFSRHGEEIKSPSFQRWGIYIQPLIRWKSCSGAAVRERTSSRETMNASNVENGNLCMSESKKILPLQ